MKIRRCKFDIFIEICCLLCLFGTLIYLIAIWEHIPGEIPGHYNAMGEIDRITSKESLLVIPIITWIMYIGLTVVEKFPQIWNTGVTVTEENMEKVYRILKSMLGTFKLSMVAKFTYLTIYSAMAKPLSIWFLPISLIIMFGLLTFFIIKLVKAK